MAAGGTLLRSGVIRTLRYAVRLMADQPLCHRIEELERKLDLPGKDCAASKLSTILQWLAEVAYGLLDSDICLKWDHREVLLASLYRDATFYYVVRERCIYPVGVVFAVGQDGRFREHC